MAEKIRVLHAAKYYPPQYFGGIETAVEAMCRGCRDRKDIEIVTLVSQIKGKRTVTFRDGMTLYSAAAAGRLASTPVSPDYVYLLKKLSRNADIIHVHLPNPLADVAVQMSGFKGKVVVSWHSDIVRQKVLKKFYYPVENRLLKRADRIICAAEGVLDHSEDLAPYRDKCVIIPYCISEEVENKSRAYLESCKTDTDALSDPDRPLKLLSVGRLVYYKGYSYLLDALAKTKNHATLQIVGEGPLLEELKQKADTLGLGERVTFLGRVPADKIETCYEDCDVFVFPSIYKSEAYGIVQMEAMAYGKPVINTDLPSGVPSVSVDRETGLTVPPMDADALAGAIDFLADHPETRLAYGRAAREKCMQEYRQEIMADRIDALYRALLHRS